MMASNSKLANSMCLQLTWHTSHTSKGSAAHATHTAKHGSKGISTHTAKELSVHHRDRGQAVSVRFTRFADGDTFT
jgi:hypothetical protein